jgi:hypothetical protein
MFSIHPWDTSAEPTHQPCSAPPYVFAAIVVRRVYMPAGHTNPLPVRLLITNI